MRHAEPDGNVSCPIRSRAATPTAVRAGTISPRACPESNIRDTLLFSENKSQVVQLPGDSFGAVVGHSGSPSDWHYNDEAVADPLGGYKIKGHGK
jgi:hypothetical protein